jgi:hypothetical protein
MTSVQQEPSANNPCASTTLLALTTSAPAVVREPTIIIAAVAPSAAENVRLFIIISLVTVEM